MNTETARKILYDICASYTPVEKANKIYELLKKRCVVCDGTLYNLTDDKNIIFEPFNKIDDKLGVIVTFVLDNLYNKYFSETDKKMSNEIKGFNKIFKNSDIKEYIPQLIELLTVKKLVVNDFKNEIHFMNGYIDLKTHEFKKRELNYEKGISTLTINRNYTKSDEKTQKEIMKNIIYKVLQNKEDVDRFLLHLGCGIMKDGAKHQKCNFLMGVGSNGKSMFINLIEKTMDVYYKELTSSAFTGSESTVNKNINSMIDFPYSFVVINELDSDKINKSAFKSFVDGKTSTTRLYSDKAHNIVHNATMFVLSNVMPKYYTDGGMERRIDATRFTTRFVKDKKDVNEKEHVYLKDYDLIDKFEKDEFLNAMFDIMLTYAKKYVEMGRKLPDTENSLNARNEILNNNNPVKEFIENNIIITNDINDKINKLDMASSYKIFKGKSYNVSNSEILQEIKNLGVKYDDQKRSNGVKGCYLGVKFIKKEKDNEFIEDEEEHNEISLHDYKLEIKNLKETNEKQLKLIEELQKQINDLTKPKKLKKEKKEKKESEIKCVSVDSALSDIDVSSESVKNEDEIKLIKKTKTKTTKNKIIKNDVDDLKNIEGMEVLTYF